MLAFPNKRYKVIYADPPWQYNDNLGFHGGGAESHYDTMSLEDICKLPVRNISDDDCILFIWGTWPMLNETIQVINSWEFNYKTCAFVWLKDYNNGKNVLGLGRWTRGNTEFCLLATKGQPNRVSNNISQLVKTIPKEHSKKPNQVRNRIVQLCGDLPRIELFARTKIHGWDVWGNDPKLELQPLEAFN